MIVYHSTLGCLWPCENGARGKEMKGGGDPFFARPKHQKSSTETLATEATLITLKHFE